MVRVAHQKSAKQANANGSLRGAKAAKQKGRHKVVVEGVSKDKATSRSVLSFHADPPPGYTFIPAGHPELTAAMKDFAKKQNKQILAVTTTPHASRHELSREVHRVGFHFPTEVVAEVCSYYGIRLTSGGKLVEEKDDDKLFMKVYQRGQLVLDEQVRDQVTINTEAKQIIKDLFPNIPDNDMFQIIKTAFQLGDNKVGTAEEIPLVRRAQLSVVAHVRHTYTKYDRLLRQVAYSDARHRVESETLQKLLEWRGEKDDNNAVEDTLREVVVISDEEETDDDVEEGQLLDHNQVKVLPVDHVPQAPQNTGDRARSPIVLDADDAAPGYRFVPQVVRRYPVHDLQTIAASRQQSRYAIWDQMRQQYRRERTQQHPRVIERIILDDTTAISSQPIRVGREPQHALEPIRTVMEPPVRIVRQPVPQTYVRGADGIVYERITTQPAEVQPSVVRQRMLTPPRDNSQYHLSSRPASPRTYPPRLHQRTASFEDGNGTVLPSIESPGGGYSSPNSRQMFFEESHSRPHKRQSGLYQEVSRQSSLIDLTSQAEQASKRLRLEDSPPSPYLRRPHPQKHESFQQSQVVELSHPEFQPRHNEPIGQPNLSRQANIQERDLRTYRDNLPGDDSLPLRVVDGHHPISLQPIREPIVLSSHNPHYMTSPRRVSEYAHRTVPSFSDLSRQQYVAGTARDQLADDRVRVRYEEPAQIQPYSAQGTILSSSRVVEDAEPARYIRNPFDQNYAASYGVREIEPHATEREHPSSSVPYPIDLTHDSRQPPTSTARYSLAEPTPHSIPSYRNDPGFRTTYVQN